MILPHSWSPWRKSALGAHVLTGCSLPCCRLTGCSTEGCTFTQCSLRCVSTQFAVSFAHSVQHSTLCAHTVQRSSALTRPLCILLPWVPEVTQDLVFFFLTTFKHCCVWICASMHNTPRSYPINCFTVAHFYCKCR